MTGYVIPCVPKRSVTFAMTNGTSNEVILADRVELVHWREITMMFRVHSHTLGGTPNTIQLGVYAQTHSGDDPGLLFIDPESITTVSLNQNTPTGALLELPFQDWNNAPYHAPMLRVVAQATKTATGQLSAVITADISVKDS
jgi:hypothetical protein